MEGLDNLFSYFDSFQYSKENSEFGDKWNYPKIKDGNIKFKFNCCFKNGEEFDRECILNIKTSEDGWISLDKYYKFRYKFGFVQEILTLKEEQALKIILILLNLQVPIVVGPLMKKVVESDKIKRTI